VEKEAVTLSLYASALFWSGTADIRPGRPLVRTTTVFALSDPFSIPLFTRSLSGSASIGVDLAGISLEAFALALGVLEPADRGLGLSSSA
jgi:hypothetical protein